jgi:excisionase family DNA binding protein
VSTTTAATGTRLLSVAAVADRLECSRNHVYALVAKGGLRAVDLRASGTKAKTRIRESDLEAFIGARTA